MSKTTEGVRRKEAETDLALDVDQTDEKLVESNLDASSDIAEEETGQAGGGGHDAETTGTVSEEDDKPVDSDVRRLKIARDGVVTPALAVITVALAALVIALGVTNHRHESADDAGEAARTEATRNVTKMLSYTPTTVSDFPGNEAWLTGGFKSKYHSLMADKVAPEAQKSGVSAKAQVVHTAVTSASTDRVELLMFINVQLTAKGSETPQDTGSRVRVGVTKVDGRWLINRFDTL